MEISFSKEYKHNYLVVRDDRVLSDDYQLKMMTRNKVSGLLNCQERMINGEGLLYYEVTSKQTVKVVYEYKKLKFEDVKRLFLDLQGTLEGLRDFMLADSGLIVNPEYIFLDLEKNKYFFLYYPFYDSVEKKDADILTEFLTENVDSNDMKAVEAVYQVAEMLGRQHYGLEEAIEWFVREFQEESEAKEESIQEQEQDSLYDDNEYQFGNSEIFKERKKTLWEKFKEWLAGDNEKENEIYVKSEFYENSSGYEADMEKQDRTVFIPWLESSEQKLYGMGKNKYHIDLTRAPFLVGKMKGQVDVVINENSISRIHARFLKKGNKYCMQDLNSTNGSFKNGMRLNPNDIVTLEPGDEIALGKLKFIYR